MKGYNDIRYVCEYYKNRISDYIQFSSELGLITSTAYNDRISKYEKEIRVKIENKLNYH